MSSATIDIDLTEARRAAEAVRDRLADLGRRFDLAPFEYATRVRVAPNEIPHSHPILTLSTRLREDGPLLSCYLHEQMHWYMTWYSHARGDDWRTLWSRLTARFPAPPVDWPVGAGSLASSQLHLIVNWLQIEATAAVLGRDAARAVAQGDFVYSGVTQLVIENWDALGALFAAHGLTPIRPATQMTAHDLALAARMDEAPTRP